MIDIYNFEERRASTQGKGSSLAGKHGKSSPSDDLRNCRSFEWDDANAQKILETHGVQPTECEQVFACNDLFVAADIRHSQSENRYHALGEASGGRRLLVVFTIRGDRVRVISARDMSRGERKRFERD